MIRYSKTEKRRRNYEEAVDKQKSPEYAADIFNASFGDGLSFIFNGNVINNGSIPNLPYDDCVEIPVTVDRMGFNQSYVGNLPKHLAILVNTTF